MENYTKKIVQFDGKPHTVEIIKDGKHLCCTIKEVSGIIFQAKEEDNIEEKAIAMLSMWKKHESIWGMKNLKMKQFNFQIFKHTFRITLMTPYASKSWLYHWYKSKSIKSFTIRLCGINLYYAEPNSKEKLLKKIQERAIAKG